MSWFRIHTSLLHNRKVQSLDPKIFKYLVNLWCLAKEGNGTIPTVSDIAFHLRIAAGRALQVVSELEIHGLLVRNENGTFHPHDWDEHQYTEDYLESDKAQENARKSNAERQRRFRERNVTNGQDVTLRNVTGNVSNVTPDTESETDTEQSQKQTQKKPAPADAVRVWFESEFWPLYPQKKAQPPALKAARAHLRTEELRALALQGLNLQLPDLRARDPQYVPLPATWINQHRWEDEKHSLFIAPAGPQASQLRESATDRAIRVGLENVARTGRL